MLDAAHSLGIIATEREPRTPTDAAGLPSGSRPAWCCVATYSQAERRAHAALHRFGFTAYLPLVTVRLPDRHYHTRPLFPGYLFVQLHLDRPWSPVVNCPGVFSLLTFDGTKPATCSDAVVRAVREAVDAADAFSAASPLWKPGTPCTMASGPFSGHPAVITQVGADMATVAVLMFGHLREVAVQLDALSPRSE